MAFDLINVFNITDDANLELNGAINPVFARVNGTPFLFVMGADDDGLTVFKINAKGKLKAVDVVPDNAVLQLAEVFGGATVAVGHNRFLITAGQDDNGISSFRIKPNGKLKNVDNVADDAILNLDAANAVAQAVVGGKKFVFVSSLGDGAEAGGISVFQVAGNGTLINKDNVDDNDNVNFELDGARGLATATIGTKTFLFVTAITDNGVSSFEVAADGTLTNRDNVDDGDDAALLLDGANAAATAKVGDRTFLVTVASNDDDGISVFEVSATGTLTNVDNVADDATLNLDGALGINTVKFKGITYVFATGFGDDGFSAFVVAADGTLINVDNVKEADNPTDFELVDAHGLTTVKVGKDFFLFVTGRQDDGVSAFKIIPEGLTIIGSGAGELIDNTSSAPGQPLASGLADKIFGLGGNDALKGLGGNDLLDGGAGQDFLFGNKGADRFVFALATDTAVGATRDVIVDFRHKQHDKIDLSDIDANINVLNDQAFKFIGHQQFSGNAGELRFANHIVRGDIDGDGVADFEIGINGKVDLVKADFIL